MRLSRSVLQRGVNVAAFLVPGFALWLPSGYSYGALALLLLAILSLPQWLGKPVPRHTVGLALAITLMALVLLLDFDPSSGSLKALDRPIKYLAALPCLLMLAQWAPTCKAVWRGVAVGAWGAGCVGAWQVWGQGLERAAGHTNEIQYGNLALCLGVMCLIGLVCLWARWRPDNPRKRSILIGASAAVARPAFHPRRLPPLGAVECGRYEDPCPRILHRNRLCRAPRRRTRA